MIGLGVLLLVIGAVVVVVGRVTSAPALLDPIGWICVTLGVIFIVLGIALPLLHDNTLEYDGAARVASSS